MNKTKVYDPPYWLNGFFMCPRCDQKVFTNQKDCPYCGQHFDWKRAFENKLKENWKCQNQ